MSAVITEQAQQIMSGELVGIYRSLDGSVSQEPLNATLERAGMHLIAICHRSEAHGIIGMLRESATTP